MFRRHPRQEPDWPPGAYLVGGAVRDRLLKREAKDCDWLVPDAAAAAAWLAQRTGGSAFATDEERGFWRVSAGGVQHDLTPVPPEGVEADLLRRDFTINAMAMDSAGRLLDPAGGQRDLRARLLRAVSEGNLRDDTLRPLRAVRFVAVHGLRLEEGTRGWIGRIAGEQAAGSLASPSVERIRDELSLIVASPDPAAALTLADSLGLLDLYLPEISAGRGVEQTGGLHHLDVMQHSLEALRRLVATFPDADLATRWAALLHDVGKPASRCWDEANGRWSFFGHDRVGAQIARDLLERHRYPHALRDRVAALVDRHMLRLPADERSARRFAHRNRALLPELLQVMLADREAARGPRSGEGGRIAYQRAMSLVLAALEQSGPQRPLLDGSEIMALLGLEPGPAVGRAVAFLAEAQAVGDASDAEGAKRLLAHWAKAQGLLQERARGDGTIPR